MEPRSRRDILKHLCPLLELVERESEREIVWRGMEVGDGVA